VYGEINLLRPWADPLFGLEHTIPEFIASLKLLELLRMNSGEKTANPTADAENTRIF